MADVDMNVTFETLNDNVSVDFGSVYFVDNGVAVKIVADLYSHDNVYVVGNYVIHNELLYKCIVPIHEPEEFDPEKWERIKIMHEFATKADVTTVAALSGNIAFLNYSKADKETTYTKTEVDDIVYNILPDDTASGAIANFNTSLELPIKSLEIDVNAKQESGTPTPSTPLPISGWSEISLVQRGTNLWDEVWELGAIDNQTGQNADNNNTYRSKNYIQIPKGVNLYLVNGNSDTLGLRFYDSNKNFIGSRAFLTSKVMTYGTNDLLAGTAYIRFVNTSTNVYLNNIAINYPSSDNAYHAYNGNTEVINLGGTYYGGRLTQDKDGHRQFEVTHGIADLSTLTDWSRVTNYTNPFFRATLPNDCKQRTASSSPNNSLCDSYSWFSGAGNYWQNIGNYEYYCAAFGLSSNNRIYIRNDSYSDKDTFVSSLSGVYLVYELETPYTIDLPDGQPIITLNGTNNIYADTGDTSVVFKSSVNDYVSAHSVVSGAKSLGTSKGGSEEQSEEKETEEKEPEVKEHEEEKKEEKELSEDTPADKK